MRFIKQFAIIMAISFIGEILNYFIPLPVPASIYGLVLMFLALKFKIFKVSSVKDAGGFLLDVMPLMFVPPVIAILDNLEVLKANWWKFLVVGVISTVLVMVVTGLVTQWIIRLENKIKNGGERHGDSVKK
ncbi:CidA/LrgA family protein [Treponema zioleckii]|uniref:CidA/LrgA family protein n=1 Tax=Treponema zioleckii TaxID=331680 RepID=UPI00168BAB7D|nr:CidA/LrgA family protein [Treponema zioleckii]